MNPTARWLPAASLVVAFTAACTGERAHPSTAEVRDSAGVRIVSHDLREAGVPTYGTLGEHDLEIGRRDGPEEYTFSSIADVRVAEDGAIFVADGISNQIRVYDRDGRHRITIGGKGEGPGEFAAAPLIAGIAGDTVFAWDGRSRRVTSLSRGGRLIGTITIGQESPGRPLRVARLTDGTHLSVSRWVAEEPSLELHDLRVERDSVAVERLDATGVVMDTLRVLPDVERVERVEGGGGVFRTQRMSRPFTPRAFVLTDGEGSIVGHSASFELVFFGRDAGARQILRVRPPWPAPTPAEIRSRIEAQLEEAAGDGEVDPRTRRVYEEYLPERVPAYSNALVTGDGDLWVRRYELDAEAGGEWLVFSPTGELLGSVSTPPGLRLHDVRRDFVVGVVRDELDVQYVRRYPLGR